MLGTLETWTAWLSWVVQSEEGLHTGLLGDGPEPRVGSLSHTGLDQWPRPALALPWGLQAALLCPVPACRVFLFNLRSPGGGEAVCAQGARLSCSLQRRGRERKAAAAAGILAQRGHGESGRGLGRQGWDT